MSIAVEEQRIRSLFDRVETVEDVAKTLPEDDERRAKLLAVSHAALAEEGTVRPVIAAATAIATCSAVGCDRALTPGSPAGMNSFTGLPRRLTEFSPGPEHAG